MTLGQNGVLKYGHFRDFLEFFGDRMANLGLIDLVCISNLMYMRGKNKFEVHISKHLAKMAMNWHK